MGLVTRNSVSVHMLARTKHFVKDRSMGPTMAIDDRVDMKSPLSRSSIRHAVTVSMSIPHRVPQPRNAVCHD